jgi:16S rRNA G966 N2-methylase RsmD
MKEKINFLSHLFEKKGSSKATELIEQERKFSLNTKQSGEALELLSNLESNSVSLVFLDPQYEPVKNVLSVDYPLYCQSDYQILRILEQIERVLRPSSFCLL